MVSYHRSAASASPKSVVAKPRLLELNINQIRRDGQTQGRASLNLEVIREYTELIGMGAEFPPVRAWFDGCTYWLTDGFHRLAALDEVGSPRVIAEVHQGSLSDAQWDSYGCNAVHGLRRNRSDLEAIIKRALEHPKGHQLSNAQVAKHLHVPEATLRRWRKQLSSSCDEDNRLAVRGGITYLIDTAKIGKSSPSSRSENRSKTRLKESLIEMKSHASPQALRVLNIVGNWVFGGATASSSLQAIERLLDHHEEDLVVAANSRR